MPLAKILLSIVLISFIPSFYAFSKGDRYSPAIDWQYCSTPSFKSWFPTTPPPHNLLCGYLDVPLTYEDELPRALPNSAAFVRIAITRLPATNKHKGNIVIIPGGPGQQGINPGTMNSEAFQGLLKNWDLIGYDPRGVGQSIPSISCPVSSELDPDAIPEGITHSLERLARSKVDSCIKNSGLVLLKHISTNEAVRDLEMIRTALGEDKLTAIAYSYGTKVAGLYAARYPENTRAIVLDGIVDLTESYFEQRLSQSKSYQMTFERFYNWCSLKSSCPLGSSFSEAIDHYLFLLEKLDIEPARISESIRLDSTQFIDFTLTALLWKSDWPLLYQALTELTENNLTKDTLYAINEESRIVDSDALMAINCSDSAQPHLPISTLRQQKKEIYRAMPFTDYPFFDVYPRDECDFWPFTGKDSNFLITKNMKLPFLLFVANRYDPTTPWANARKMATAFNSPLITLEQDGHGSALTGVSQCIDELVISYLKAPQIPQVDRFCF